MSAHLKIVTTDADKAPLLNPPELSWPVKQMILMSGRSWWTVRYDSGKVLSEWETVQESKSGSDLTGEEKTTLRSLLKQGLQRRIQLPLASQAGATRWEDIPKQGIRGLYLVCPVGAPGVAALETSGDYQFFQLKVGHLTVGAGTFCEAHIIGKVVAGNGKCICYAWEYDTRKIVRFEDNVTHLTYRSIGPLSLGHHTGIR